MWGKIFECMYTGSMVGAGAEVFAVWGYVLAHTKRTLIDNGQSEGGKRLFGGVVEINPELVAHLIGMTKEQVAEVLTKLQTPDSDSRSVTEEGRRLVKIGPMSYWVVNWQKYHDIRNEVERREYQRMKQAEYRSERHTAPKPAAPEPELPFPESPEFVTLWAEWEGHRKHKGAKMTVETRRRQLQRCSREGLPRALASIRLCLEKGWTGLVWDNLKVPAAPKQEAEPIQVWDGQPKEQQ